MMLGAGEDAREVLEAAVAIGEDSGETRLAIAAGIYLARAHVVPGPAGDAGDPGDAGREAAAGLAVARRATGAAAEAGLDGLQAMGLTAIAELCLLTGQTAEALDRSREALALRDRLGGLEEGEAEVFVVRAVALEGAEDGEAADQARAIRARGAARVMEIADGLGDEALRRSFLTNVPANRDLVSSHPAGRKEHRSDDLEH